MVLEDVSSSDPLGSAPSSDSDIYEDGQKSSMQQIAIANIPPPIPIIGTLLGFSQKRTAHKIAEMLQKSSEVIGRPVRQSEVECIAQGIGRGERIRSQWMAMGVGLGLARCYQTAGSWRFPFYDMSKVEGFSADKFGPLRGLAARIQWHNSRALAYAFVGFVPALIIGRIVGATSTTAMLLNDPRLEDYVKDLRARSEKKVSQTLNRQYRPAQPHRSAVDAQEAQEEDDTSLRLPPISQVTRQRPDRSISNTAQHAIGNSPNQSSTFSKSQPEDFGSTYDDTSPTAGMEDGSSSTGESSWDKIRRQSSSGQQSSQSSSWDSFSSSSSGYDSQEDSQSARAKLQREFDAKVEKERQGKNFNDSSKSDKWW